MGVHRISRRAVALKSVDINPTDPNLMVFGCGDSLIRVFDRRMLRVGAANSYELSKECEVIYAPPHLEHDTDVHTTYVRFSPDGTQILATYNG